MASILARSGSLPARTARDGERIIPGHIYVAPSDGHMLVHDRRIMLSRGPAENGHRPAGRLMAELVLRDRADPGPPADDRSGAETTVAEFATVADQLWNRPVGLSCPSCHSAMFEFDGAPSPSYRCRFGHAWSPESLLLAQRESVDATLWTALRALEEWAVLSRQLATASDPREGVELSGPHAARVDRIEHAAAQVRRLLARIGYQE